MPILNRSIDAGDERVSSRNAKDGGVVVNPGRDAARDQRVSGLGVQRTRYPGENVAAAGGSEDGRPGGAYERGPVRRGDDGRQAFEKNGRVGASRELAANLESSRE